MEGGIREHSSSFILRKSSGCVPGGRLAQAELNQEKGGNGDAVTHQKLSPWIFPPLVGSIHGFVSFNGGCYRLLLVVPLFWRV